MKKNMSWIKYSLYLSIGWLLILIPFLLIIELLFGNWIASELDEKWNEAERYNVLRNLTISYDISSVYEDPQKIIKYSRDKNGLRMTCSSPADIDILTIGGSTTDQRYLKIEDTFQYNLEKRLNARLGREVCVANAGLDGHSSHGHLASFQYWFPLIKDLSPKHILLYIGINDAGFRFEEHEGFDSINEDTFQGYLKANSVIYSAIRRLKYSFVNSAEAVAYAGHNDKYTYTYSAMSLNDSTPNLAKKNSKFFYNRMELLLARINQMNAKHICITQPHRLSVIKNNQKKGILSAFKYQSQVYNGLDYDFSLTELNDVLYDLCTKERVIDIYNHSFDEDSFYDLVHTTPKGSKEIGEKIYSDYINKGFIDEL
mgnify:FL=1